MIGCKVLLTYKRKRLKSSAILRENGIVNASLSISPQKNEATEHSKLKDERKDSGGYPQEGCSLKSSDQGESNKTEKYSESKLSSPLLTFHRRAKRKCKLKVGESVPSSVENSGISEASQVTPAKSCVEDASTNLQNQELRRTSNDDNHSCVLAGSEPQTNAPLEVNEQPQIVDDKNVVVDVQEALDGAATERQIIDLNISELPDENANNTDSLTLDLSIPLCDSVDYVACNAPQVLCHKSEPSSGFEVTVPCKVSTSKSLELFDEKIASELIETRCTSIEAAGNACKDTASKNYPFQFSPEDKTYDFFPLSSTPKKASTTEFDDRTANLQESRFLAKSVGLNSSLFLGPSSPMESMVGRSTYVSSFPWSGTGKQLREFLPSAVPQPPTDHAAFLFRHQMILDNIVNRFPEKLEYQMMWSEEELDSLWIGVRRHGRGRWDAMLRDPRLHFFPWRSSRDLSERWEFEQSKLLCSGRPIPHARQPRKLNLINDLQLSHSGPFSPCYHRGKRSRAMPFVESSFVDGLPTEMAVSGALPRWIKEAVAIPIRPFDPPNHMFSDRLQSLHSIPTFPVVKQQRKFEVPEPDVGKKDELIVIHSDDSSEETISDDHNLQS